MKRIDIPSLVLGAIGATILSAASVAIATRSAAGTYSLPALNPVVVGTTIADTWANNTMSDLATEMTDSWSRSGKGAALAAMAFIDGTVNAPGITNANEAGSGIRRAAAFDWRMVINQTDKTYWNATGFGVGVVPAFPLDVATFVGKTHARFGVNTANPLFVVSGSTSGIGLGYNLQHNGTNWLYDTTATGAIAVWDTSANSLDMYTAPSGTAGTAATLTKRTSTNANGFTIGTSGTAISQSNRGTASLTPAAILTQACQAQSVTVTGAAAGGECAYSIPAGGNPGLSIACNAAAGSCGLTICNPTLGTLTPPAGTYSCRVFNP